MKPVLQVAESAAAYAARAPVVVDASAVVAVVFGEPNAADALAWMKGRALCAPHLIDFEFANVALGKLRGGTEVEGAIELFDALAIARHGVATTPVVELAARYSLSAYDAAYLWLAEALRAPLITFDARLGAAARTHLVEGGPGAGDPGGAGPEHR